VLAETDVINMVSRGIMTPNILRGIHDSMAGRLALLLRSLGAQGVVLVTGGLAADVGLLGALQDVLNREKGVASPPTLVSHPLSIFAGAIGAALWGEFRHRKLNMRGAAWAA
jgi:benzoyl-CoA reductase subunit D